MALCSSNLTSGFIDLATFDEIEKYMYGGPDATAYFVRETRKSTWFTQVPVCLSRASGMPQFGQEFHVSISRAGDYLLHTWLRATVPAVNVVGTNDSGVALAARWTKNLMHNLVHECQITFNDLVAARFDNYHLDFWSAFTLPSSKRAGYDTMIGNLSQLVDPKQSLPETTLNLPLPFFYSRDSGVALPTAALPYNEMRISFQLRDWTDLLILETPGATTESRSVPTLANLNGVAPELKNVQVWANYAIVSNDERKRMACAPRDILVEQVQTAPRQSFTPATNPQQSFDVRFSHAIKVLFFSVRNTTARNEWSNYGSLSPLVYDPNTAVVSSNDLDADPISVTSLIYENTQRLSQMGSDYFSLVNPYYHAQSVPTTLGLHMYSYSLDFLCLDPMGSTNYGKLTNVSVVPEASAAAVAAAGGKDLDGADVAPQKYELVVTAVNNNIIRVSGGALGFPVL